MHKFLSCTEAAAVLGITREAVRLRATTGRIPAIKTSAGWMVDAVAVAREAAVRGNHTGKIGRDGVRAITAAIGRGAFGQDRAAYWAEQIVNAASAQDARELIAVIDSLQGLDGPGPGAAAAEAEAEADALEALLYPPPPGREKEWARLAASGRARIDADVAAAAAEDFSHLFPPDGTEEPGQRVTARWRSPLPQPVNEDELSPAEWRSLFNEDPHDG